MVSVWWLLVAFGAGVACTLIPVLAWLMRVARAHDRATGWG